MTWVNLRRHTLFLILTLSVPALAGTAEKYWMHAGAIDSISYDKGRIIVDDLELIVIATSKTSDSSGKPLALPFLKKGNIVGVNYTMLPGIGRVLVKLQVYPAGSTPRTDSED